MNRSENLKAEILKKYHSVRQFAIDMQIPYSTLNSALEKGIETMSYGTVLKICEKLNLNPIDLKPLDESSLVARPLFETKLINEYLRLNNIGRKKVLDYMNDMLQIKKYKG